MTQKQIEKEWKLSRVKSYNIYIGYGIRCNINI